MARASTQKSRGRWLLTKEETMTDSRPLTFGEKAVGLTFNPSGDDRVQRLKAMYAAIIDELVAMRDGRNEQSRLASIAITEAQGAQMWAVKAATWKD
jgi:hypothetical protein